MKKLKWKKEKDSQRGAEVSAVDMLEFYIEREFYEDGGWMLYLYAKDDEGEFGGDPAFSGRFDTKREAKNHAQKIVDSIVRWQNEA